MRRRFDTDLVAMAVVLGIAGGLAEGVCHMLVQKLGVLDNVWYPIIWIAGAFNGLLVTAAGLVLAGALSLLPDRPRVRAAAVFVIVLLSIAPGIAWLFKEWIYGYSIAIVVIGIAVACTRALVRRPLTAGQGFRWRVRWAVALLLGAFAVIEGGAYLAERIGTSRLPAAARPSPNILLIVIDALRADRLSAYGHDRPTSPAIDRLAREGTLFEQAFSTSSYTLPSHGSILTGLYPYQHGLEWRVSHTWTPHTTLPEMLQRRGYRTAAFSGNTFWFTREHGFGKGFLHFDDFFHSYLDMAVRTAYGGAAARYLLVRLGYEDLPARKRAPETNARVLRWIATDTKRPFFVTINYMDVHDPYLPPQPYRNRFTSTPNPGGLLHWLLHVPETLSPEQLQSELDAYDGSIAYVDDQIGALLAAIRQRQGDRDLLVVITSDHGEEFGEHGGFLHGRHLYREAIHVPLIIWQPEHVAAGLRISRPVSNAAIPATILDLLGAAPPPELARSLKPLWTDAATAGEWAWPLIELKHRPWEPDRDPVHHGSLRALVSPTLHYIEHDTRGPELYDWVADPVEITNLIKRPDVQPAVEQFRERLRGQHADRSAR